MWCDPESVPDQRDERGQAMPLLVVLVLLAGLAAVGLGRLGLAATERAAAQAAADAAALAGAAGGEEAARDVASRNGATVVSFRTEGASVTLTVALGRARATARATATWAMLTGAAAPSAHVAGGRVPYTRSDVG